MVCEYPQKEMMASSKVVYNKINWDLFSVIAIIIMLIYHFVIRGISFLNLNTKNVVSEGSSSELGLDIFG